MSADLSQNDISASLRGLIKSILRSFSDDSHLAFYKNLSKAKYGVLSRKKIFDTDQDVIILKTLYQSSEYTALLYLLKTDSGLFVKIQHLRDVLLKARDKQKLDSDLVETLDVLIPFFEKLEKILSTVALNKIFGVINKKKLGGALYHLLSKQRLIFLDGEYDSFRDLCTKEKFVTDSLVELGEKLYLLNQGELERPSRANKIKLAVMRSFFAFVVLFGVYAYSIPEDGRMKVSFAYGQLTDSLHDTDVELEFEKQFGMNVFGSYVEEDIAILTKVLSTYSGTELKKLNVARFHFFTDSVRNPLSTSSYVTGGYCQNDLFEKLVGGSSVGFLTGHITAGSINHELGHAHHKNLPSGSTFDVKWLRACGDGHTFEVHVDSSGKPVYIENGSISLNTPAFGHASAYGSTDFKEDVAEFVKHIKTNAVPFSAVRSHLSVYKEKVALLYEFGFITKRESERCNVSLKLVGELIIE